MATTQTFVIEYGLSVGSSEVINSSGKIAAGAMTNIDTDDIAEGSSSLYFTSGRFNSSFDTRLSNATIDGGTI